MKIAIEITRNFGELSNRLNILRIYNENKQWITHISMEEDKKIFT